MSQHIDPTPKQTSLDALNDSIVPILNIKQLWYAYDNAPCLFVQTTDDHIFKVQLTQVS